MAAGHQLVVGETYIVVGYNSSKYEKCATIQVTDYPDSKLADFSFDISRFENITEQRKRKLLKLLNLNETNIS